MKKKKIFSQFYYNKISDYIAADRKSSFCLHVTVVVRAVSSKGSCFLRSTKTDIILLITIITDKYSTVISLFKLFNVRTLFLLYGGWWCADKYSRNRVSHIWIMSTFFRFCF